MKALRARNLDILTALEAERIAASDEQQLVFANSVGRTLFSRNTRDFVQLHGEHLNSGREHSGIVVSDQLQVGVLIRRLLKLADTLTAEDMRNRLEFLSNWRDD